MAYPGPPGVSAPHPSLPPRPPPAPGKPPSRFSSTFSTSSPSYPTIGASAYPPSTGSYSGASTTYGAATTAAPATTQYGVSQPPATYSYPQGPVTGGRGGRYGGHHQRQPHQQQNSNYGYAQGYGPQPISGGGAYGPQYGAYAAAPQIRNPFPAPSTGVDPRRGGGGAGDYDTEMAAQIAQWQSAYVPRDPNAMDNAASMGGPGGGGGGRNGGRFGAPGGPGAVSAVTYSAGPSTFGPALDGMGGLPGAGGADGTGIGAATAAGAGAEGGEGASGSGSGSGERKKTVYRQGGGKKWADDTLLEWDPSHLRLFVGNLAGEVTDDSLLKAFARWKSVQKAKVVRDKRTNKSKGFGFVSFSDSDDFFQAAKEMNGKYIQSHPVVVRKSTTEIKVAPVKDDKKGGKGGGHKKAGGGGNNRSGSGAGSTTDGQGYEPSLGPVGGGGVHKSGQKMRGGLKLLG